MGVSALSRKETHAYWHGHPCDLPVRLPLCGRCFVKSESSLYYTPRNVCATSVDASLGRPAHRFAGQLCHAQQRGQVTPARREAAPSGST
jgi:hypothetical protein